MATIKEQIQALYDEINKTQKNKATNAHIGKLKAKIAQLKLKEEKAAASAKAAGPAKGFEVKKSGDASVALVGFPSVGKSTLITQVTDAKSEAGNFAFTTLTCIPGLMEHRGAKIQILDLPGLIKGAAEGKGRGKEKIENPRKKKERKRDTFKACAKHFVQWRQKERIFRN